MAAQKTADGMVKKEFMMVIALITFVSGFLVGVVFSSMQSTQVQAPARSRQASAPPPQSSGLSPDQASRIMTLEKQVAANPEDSQAWASLGNVYFDAARFQKSINAYERSLAINPSQANVLVDLGVMYRRNKQPDMAMQSFDKATSLNPTHEQARFNKGIVYMYDLNQKDEAIKSWEELLTINPNAMAPNGQSVQEMIDSLK